MKKKALEIIAIFATILSFISLAFAGSLTDISGHKYQNAIQSLVDDDVIHGYPDGTYKPDQTVNRAEFLKIIIGSTASSIGDGANCFPDVKTDWYAKYVCYAKNNGIVEGYPDGDFRPAQTINYVEALKIVYKANNDSGKTTATDEWYSKYTEDAEENNVAVSGIGYSQLLKRGEIAQIVWNYLVEKGIAEEDTSDETDTNDDTTDTTDETDTDTDETTETDTTPYDGNGKIGVDLSACSSAQIDGNALYVSPNGNDGSGDGSEGNPYKTVETALQNVSANYTIVLRDGTYSEPNELRIREENVTIRSYPGEWAIIDRSSDFGDAGVYFYVGSDGGKLQCVEVIGGWYAVSTETMWDWGEADKSGASNILIENTKLHGSGYDVVKIKPNSDNITIRRSEIYDSGNAQSPGDCNAEGIDNVNGDNTLVQDNYIHDTCSTGVYLKGGATNGIIEGNVIENTGAAGILVGFDTSPEFFDLGVNPNYYENIDGIVRNNLIKNTEWAGIGLYASKDAEVYNNTIIDTAQTYHSPIYFGVTFQDWEPGAGRPANTNANIHDNIVSQSSSINMPIVSIRYSDELGGLSGLEGVLSMAGNCYYQEGGAAMFEDMREEVDMGGWYEAWTGTLSEWQALQGTDTDSIEADPQLDGDDKPQNSSCINKGY